MLQKETGAGGSFSNWMKIQAWRKIQKQEWGKGHKTGKKKKKKKKLGMKLNRAKQNTAANQGTQKGLSLDVEIACEMIEEGLLWRG